MGDGFASIKLKHPEIRKKIPVKKSFKTLESAQSETLRKFFTNAEIRFCSVCFLDRNADANVDANMEVREPM